jgi:hypothetical protein
VIGHHASDEAVELLLVLAHQQVEGIMARILLSEEGEEFIVRKITH